MKTVSFLVFLLFGFYSFLECKEPVTIINDFIKYKGEFSSIVEFSTYKTDHFWDKHGNKKPAFNRLDQKEIDVYFEYGLSDKNTVGIYASYIRNKEKLNWNKEGLGDVEICWKRYWTTFKSHQLSTRIIGIIPTNDRRTTIRYGRFGAEFDLHCQKNFAFQNRDGWYEFLAGYRYYNGFPSDQIKLNAIAGYQLFPRLRIIGSTYLDFGVFNGHDKFNGPILTLPPRYRLLKMKFHCVVSLTKYMEVFFGYSQHVWGQEIGAGNGLFTGIWIGF